MALIKKAAPAFESPESDVSVLDAVDTTSSAGVEATAAMPQAASEPTPTRQAKEAATQAIAVAASTSLAAQPPGRKFTAALQDFSYQISLDDIRSIGLAAPRVLVDQGGFSLDGKDLGKELHVQLLSYNPRYLVSPGVDNDEGKEAVRYSYDGVTIDGDTQTLKDYLNELKASDYPDASIKEYFDLWAVVVGPTGSSAAGPVIGETVVIQLSPQSAGKFKFFQVSLGIQISRGTAQATDTIRMVAERATSGKNVFGRVAFSV